jgi:hypothetical protein
LPDGDLKKVILPFNEEIDTYKSANDSKYPLRVINPLLVLPVPMVTGIDIGLMILVQVSMCIIKHCYSKKQQVKNGSVQRIILLQIGFYGKCHHAATIEIVAKKEMMKKTFRRFQ